MSGKINCVERAFLPHAPSAFQGESKILEPRRRLIKFFSHMQLNNPSGQKDLKKKDLVSMPLGQTGCSGVDAHVLRPTTETSSKNSWTPFLMEQYSTALDQMYNRGNYCFTTFLFNQGISYQEDSNKRVMYKYSKIVFSEELSTALLILCPKVKEGQSDPGDLPIICRYIDRNSNEYKALQIQENAGQFPIEKGNVDSFVEKFLGRRSTSLRLESLDRFRGKCNLLINSRKGDLFEEEWKVCLEAGENYCTLRKSSYHLRNSKLFTEEKNNATRAQTPLLREGQMEKLVKLMRKQLNLRPEERNFDFRVLLEELDSDREVIVSEDGEQPGVSHPLIIAANGGLAINAQREIVEYIFNRGRIPSGKITLFTYNATSNELVDQADNVLLNTYHNSPLTKSALLDRMETSGTLFSICHKTDSNQKQKASAGFLLGRRLLAIKEDIREKKERGELIDSDKFSLKLLDGTPIEVDVTISDTDPVRKSRIKRRFSKLSRVDSFRASFRGSAAKYQRS